MDFALIDTAHMLLALAEAESFIGATAPNPPVGACLVKDGRVLATGAHIRAGSDHAEIAAIRRATALFGSNCTVGATMYSTLEPCNHSGRTPSCAETLITAGISRVVYGIADPNPVAAGGAATLHSAGISVTADIARVECLRQLQPFLKWADKRRPWVVHKLAWRVTETGKLTMMPDQGRSTFTSETSLTIAHVERRRSDALLTGIGTVLADQPRFNVRNMPDHPNKQRHIAVISRSGRKAASIWEHQQHELGHVVQYFSTVDAALDDLGQRGCLRVLVEAGPSLSGEIIRHNLWDERLQFLHRPGTVDVCSKEFACSVAS